MTENQNTKEVLEFYEHRTNIHPDYCDHRFHRLSVTRILCKRCGLGFFDNPASPFPVTEVNREARKLKELNDKLKLENEDLAKEI